MWEENEINWLQGNRTKPHTTASTAAHEFLYFFRKNVHQTGHCSPGVCHLSTVCFCTLYILETTAQNRHTHTPFFQPGDLSRPHASESQLKFTSPATEVQTTFFTFFFANVSTRLFIHWTSNSHAL